MKNLRLMQLEQIQGGGCDRVDFWLGVAGGFSVAAGMATAGFGFVVGVVATGILAAESAYCHGAVNVYGH